MRKSSICWLTVMILVVTAMIGMLTGCTDKKAEDAAGKVIKVGYFPNMTHAQVLLPDRSQWSDSATERFKRRWGMGWPLRNIHSMRAPRR